MTEIKLEKIETIPIMGRSIVAHDPASRAFPVRGVLTEPGAPRKTKNWGRGAPYDQGQTSSCVGQSFKGILNTQPISALRRSKVRLAYSAYEFYQGGQTMDEWPGQEPRYFGTSALGVCKYLASKGLINEYRWCFGLDDVLDTLSQHGPVAVGLSWTKDMMEPGPDGFIQQTGEFVGGHETELIGINVPGQYVVGCNSWGLGWGVNGRFKIHWEMLGQLLRDDGDAVTVVSAT